MDISSFNHYYTSLFWSYWYNRLSHGTIFDFGYSRYVSRDALSYGGLKKVVQLFPSDAEKKLWDSSIKKNRSVYRKKEYSFCGENGEMFCASILNMVNYKGKNDYRQYDIWKLNWKYGRYVSKCEIVKTYLEIGVLVVVIITACLPLNNIFFIIINLFN